MRTTPSSRVIADLKAALADYDQVEEAYREAVGLERIDEERRRGIRRTELALPASKPGRAERLGRELERRLPALGELVRTALRESAHPGDPRLAVSDVARALDGHDVAQLTSLARESWRDPWAEGRHGRPSPHDPKPEREPSPRRPR